MHLSAAIFIEARAIYYTPILVCSNKALAAHSAKKPPLPTPITSSISITFPVPSNSTIRSLSITIRVASRCRSCLPILHYLPQLMQLLRVCLGYFCIICYSPSIRVNASATEPANPQKMPPDRGLIFLAVVLTMVGPQLTCPSPMITVSPAFLRASMVVWCHLLVQNILVSSPGFTNMLDQFINMIEDTDTGINISIPSSPEASLIESVPKAVHQEEDHQLVNVHGVLNKVQFTLIVVLICLSMATVWTRTSQVHQHQRYMRNYFNLNLLGMDNQGLYQDSDNIDQSSTQLASFQDQSDLMKQLINVTNTYSQDGLVIFNMTEGLPIVEFDYTYPNGSLGFLQFHSVDEVLEYFQNFQGNSFRDFLLAVQSVTVTSRLGDSKFANNYQIIADISIHGGFMMEIDIDYQYQSLQQWRASAVEGLRSTEQVFAGVLLFLFLYRLFETKTKGEQVPLLAGEQQVIRRKYLKWYLFLCLSNLLVLLSWVLSPMAAWIQLLPLFQFPDRHEDDRDAFNFNKNIRYSLPLILKIWLPLLIFLNGYVCFAVLMFSQSDGGYFSNYFSAFFDYLYQMYQCGIYQIFIEMQQYNYLADIFYFFLFFYVFMAGSTLITAFFVTLIQLKLNEKEIAIYTTNLMKSAACPNCQSENHYQLDQKMIDIMISSPKLSPLVKDRSILHSPHHSANIFRPNKKNKKDGSEIKKKVQQVAENISSNSINSSLPTLGKCRDCQGRYKPSARRKIKRSQDKPQSLFTGINFQFLGGLPDNECSDSFI